MQINHPSMMQGTCSLLHVILKVSKLCHSNAPKLLQALLPQGSRPGMHACCRNACRTPEDLGDWLEKKTRLTQTADSPLPHRGPPVVQQGQQGPSELGMLLGHEAPMLGNDLIQNVQALIRDVRRPLEHHMCVSAGPAGDSLKL